MVPPPLEACMSTDRVIVVGSGFGGLSTACYLADAGYDVTVLEKNEQLGGRASVLEAEGFRFDMGPSWYLMPDVFERFFAYFDHHPSDFYELEALDPHYRIFFKDGDSAAVTSDREEMYDLFESYEDGAGEALESYLDTSETHYRTAMDKFVYEDRPNLRDWVDLDVMRAAPIGLQLLGTMDDYVADYFDNPKLRQITQYSLVFLGGAPSNTPALYNMMSHVDFNLGVHYPENGMRSVVDACIELGKSMGVDYVTDAEVSEIINRKDGFDVESAAGAFAADYVVSDADYAHTEQELLPEHERQYDAEYWDSRTYAPSAFLMYMGVEGDVEPLEHHTLVLPEDWNH
ncbi:MAG: phytoene desaturase, partial [Natronomonas sp.]